MSQFGPTKLRPDYKAVEATQSTPRVSSPPYGRTGLLLQSVIGTRAFTRNSQTVHDHGNDNNSQGERFSLYNRACEAVEWAYYHERKYATGLPNFVRTRKFALLQPSFAQIE